ncbi:MAG: DEAD/DEAH box helicase [Acidobacteria bacterium]|nr:DEAD/DEAH box helicase [Acidobacteriota bacterium]
MVRTAGRVRGEPGPRAPGATARGQEALPEASLGGAECRVRLEALSPELEIYRAMARRVAEGHPVDPRRSSLVDEAHGVWVRPGFETFISLPRLHFEPFDYQLRAAERALRNMRGRAILADEVGLGKTIEAALVASELLLRGLAAHILVLAPTGIVEQWREELDRKFALPSVVATVRTPALAPSLGVQPSLGAQPIVIASLAAARRSPLRDAIVGREWDLVIADEAHRLKNPNSASGRLARSLRARYLLLLTATPVENRLEDLYHLLNLVRPGHLGTPREFRARYGAPGGERARGLPELRARTREIMVRHRRSEVSVALPRRLAETVRLAPGPEEAELYRLVSGRVRERGRGAPPTVALALRTLQHLAGSSPQALVPSLEKAGWADLAARAARAGPTQKARALVQILRRHGEQGEKVVVFCGFRETLDHLAALVGREDLPAAVYHGGLPRRGKDEAIRAFREDVPVLLSTEAAGEGRNLQFCHVMVNFDLPWNPMQIEQRLGRIHRIGQKRDVLVTNLVTRETIEDRILEVLEAKLNLFELVVGELDMILGRIDDDFDFEAAVFSAHVEARDDEELAGRLESLGEDLAHARREYLASRERTDGLVAPPSPAEEPHRPAAPAISGEAERC